MTGLHELKPAEGSTRNKKRRGRGDGSGHGSYSGRGIKGQAGREKVPYLFEGGQLPLIKRLPYMRGFRNRNRVVYTPVSLEKLAAAFEDGADVTPQALLERKIVRRKQDLVKVLGDGELKKKKLNVTAHAFSQSAREKIEKAGGAVTVIEIQTAKGE
jgi:large subunit ribosomal protein L15